ncbi:MAG TPA: nucleotidyl transferase AbiEii/AbiGii toxin family protein [Terracidiphilus sp.]|jgi:hypothetical protein|nr:nucleotidyl transferase AbiEii/AbiGii toxin family protein [Terracidiphilus sp.]
MTDREPDAWHREVIPASTESTLHALEETHLLEGFYLAGGTGLALQFGHRLSLDLDFFSPEHFEEDAFLQRLHGLHGFALASKAPYTLHAIVETTKVSFLGFAYPMLFPLRSFLSTPVADPRDIACMKVSAIAARGTKRDFIDIYLAAQRYGLDEILRMFEKKFAQSNYSTVHLLKSLTFFADAEKDPMPHMLVPLQWEGVKQFFVRESPRLL